MLSLRVRVAAVVGVVALVGVDVGVPPVSAAPTPPPVQAKELPVEVGTKGDPGPLTSEPRDFASEFPVEKSRPTPVDGADGGPIVLAGSRDLKRVREVVGKRTEATETFELEDGSFVTDVSVVPKWYRDVKGSWAKVDPRVVADPDRKGGLRSDGVGWSARFGSVADGISYEIEGQKFSARLTGGAPDLLPERDAKDDTVLWYRNIFPGWTCRTGCRRPR